MKKDIGREIMKKVEKKKDMNRNLKWLSRRRGTGGVGTGGGKGGGVWGGGGGTGGGTGGYVGWE